MADEVIGDYRLVKCMGVGQTSQVWEVVELTSHRHFAMKLLLPEKLDDAASRRMLFHEAEVGKKLAHPNVIRITHLSSKGQLTLPAQLMRDLHLIPGQTQLVLELRGRTLRLVPLKDDSQGTDR